MAKLAHGNGDDLIAAYSTVRSGLSASGMLVPGSPMPGTGTDATARNAPLSRSIARTDLCRSPAQDT
jgi:hypothetical protein